MNADGTDARALTMTAAFEREPRWSPEGNRLAFTRDGVGGVDVFVGSADAVDAMDVSNMAGNEQGIEWSPDGTMIAFESRSTSFSAHVINSDGANHHALVGVSGSTDNARPSWAPDSAKLIFQTADNATPGFLFSVGADGSTGRAPYPRPAQGQDIHARWSPLGDAVAFISDRSGAGALWVMAPDGSNARQLAGEVPLDSDFRWAPDGSKLVFVREQSANRDVWVVSADGSGLKNLTSDPKTDENPRWSPDGAAIVFDSTRDGNGEIYRMNADGTNPTNLSRAVGTDTTADWATCP